MPRLRRYELVGYPQHVIQRGTNRCWIFLTHQDFLSFRDYLEDACHRHWCRLHAYVLMSNHVHLIMTADREKGISRVMQLVGTRYAQYFNRVHARSGALWQGRYRAIPIDSDGYLLICHRYVELNPVRAGLVEHPGDYAWSSYHANANGRPDSLISPHFTYQALGRNDPSRRAAYRRLFENVLDQSTLGAIRESIHKGWALGSSRFLDRLERLSGRRPRPLIAVRR